ncbi:hypothetical protein CBER1_08285 [Cercospora berteroae]|uniref:Uncharacterized protein n=1 Tax=Cercospora berteroae TaxID=357750 RepID=A0A2S6C7M6_9PEZI|nr:hypothetical protein CBER1_08285 [Cercospora berteroae]
MSATRHSSTTLYGILVTEESFLKGFRTYTKAQHERKLVTHVAGQKVPSELLERMYEEVDKQARAIVDKKWETCKSRDEKWCKLIHADLMNKKGILQVHIDGQAVDAVVVASRAPTNVAAPTGPDNDLTGFVHLSIPGQTVQTVDFQKPVLVPHARVPNVTGMCWDAGPESYVTAYQNTTISSPRIHTDRMVHFTTLQEPPGGGEEVDEICISRLVHLKQVKEAIRNWNGHLIKKVVEAMEFEVVPFNAAEPLEPELLQFQRMDRKWLRS